MPGDAPGKPIILDGLRRLEYRGYDSAGIVLIEDGGLETVRAVGNLDALVRRRRAERLARPASVSATRVGRRTAGPARRTPIRTTIAPGSVSIVVNGIVENYKELRAELTARGHTFKSETDAEVVAHLIEEHIGEGLTAAVCAAAQTLQGHYAFCAVSADEPDIVVGTRHQCPLVVGVGVDEMFFASAIPAFMAHTRTIVVLEDGDVVTLRAGGAEYRRRRR